MPSLDVFLHRLSKAKKAVQLAGLKEAVILHHDESDGLASASLTKIALEKLGLETRLVCIDKLYPEIVADIESGTRRVIAYADIGSAHVELLSQANKSNNIILALDHHDTPRIDEPNVYNLNPELDGFPGETDASSSTVAYLFAKTIDKDFVSKSGIAVIGSVEVPGESRGLNEVARDDALESGTLIAHGTGRVTVKLGQSGISPFRASAMLNVLGSVGYYRNGPGSGIQACLEGFSKSIREQAKRFEEERKTANRKMLLILTSRGLSQKETVQWFHAEDNYKGMSGKVVGSFCSYLRYQRFVSSDKYLIGMMNVQPEIPGWGVLQSRLVKVSVRVAPSLALSIELEKRPSVSFLVAESCKRVGGFGDGHSVAASALYLPGRKVSFLTSLKL